ncbi:NYN domain-containing protein [Arthrobacter monumenti]
MTGDQKRIALLIDADNAPASKIELILEELAIRGRAADVRRAYGDWKLETLQPWVEKLPLHAIQPVQQFAFTVRKNATDIAMVIDAMDLLYAHSFDAFAIVSSDADFTPLVTRIRANGVKVYGFGEEKTSAAFVNACTQFTYLSELGKSPAGPKHAAPKHAAAKTAETKKTVNISEPQKAPKAGNPKDLQDPRVQEMLRNAVDASKNKDGWSHLGEVGTQIRKDTSFDRSAYGHSNLSKLFTATGLFDVRRQNLTVFVRDKRKN